MPRSVRKVETGTHEKSLRSDLRSIRAGSHLARMAANPDGTVSLARDAVGYAKQQTGLTNKAMALNAGVPESVMSDAVAGGKGRNLETDWIIAQGPEFVGYFTDHLDRALGLTDESRKAAKLDRALALVRLIFEEVA